MVGTLKDEEQPPFDELHGLRVHAWVYLGENGRKIESPIFIEPSTGQSHSLTSSHYCGIESVWNSTNYWVNMQICADGLDTLDYNFGNVNHWQHLLLGEPIHLRSAEIDLNMDESEAAVAMILDEKHLDMPTAWSRKIVIPHEVLARKFPGGRKTTWYKRTLVEEYAPYVQNDGLVTKITRFDDFECTHAVQVEEIYENRQDKFVKRVVQLDDEMITEYYDSGRPDAAISISHFFFLLF